MSGVYVWPVLFGAAGLAVVMVCVVLLELACRQHDRGGEGGDQ